MKQSTKAHVSCMKFYPACTKNGRQPGKWGLAGCLKYTTRRTSVNVKNFSLVFNTQTIIVNPSNLLTLKKGEKKAPEEI